MFSDMSLYHQILAIGCICVFILNVFILFFSQLNKDSEDAKHSFIGAAIFFIIFILLILGQS